MVVNAVVLDSDWGRSEEKAEKKRREGGNGQCVCEGDGCRVSERASERARVYYCHVTDIPARVTRRSLWDWRPDTLPPLLLTTATFARHRANAAVVVVAAPVVIVAAFFWWGWRLL